MDAEDPGPSPDEALRTLLARAASRTAGSAHRGQGAAPATEDDLASVRYRHLVEQIPAVVFTATLDAGLQDIYVSPQIEEMLGYTQQEWMTSPVLWYDRLHPDDRATLDAEFARGRETGGPFRADCRFLARDESVVWMHGEARLIAGDAPGSPLVLQGVAFDITEIKRAEQLVRDTLAEKEALLKEVHHRVKNNLQVSSSLLRLQAERVADPAARDALREGQARIRSMALVHELLYRSEDLSRIDMGDYLRQLTRELVRSHDASASSIRVELDVTPRRVSLDRAVPLGLVVNELVSNALQHAFPDGGEGHVAIRLEDGDEGLTLTVRDDGVGLPEGLDPERAETLGMRLVSTLVDQLDGRVTIRSDDGTEAVVTMPAEDDDEPG